MNVITLESVPCPLGCEPGDRLILTGRDRIHAREGSFNVVECTTCGLQRTNPRPSPASIGHFYPSDDYGPYQYTRGAAQVQEPSRLTALLRRIFDVRDQALPPVPRGRMLEIGCASGKFLEEMALRGWQVEGVELDAASATAASARGLSVHQGSIDDVQLAPGTFDVVVGWMALEHFHYPISALRRLHDWTAEGGWLVISVPDSGSLEARVFGEAWYALHLPNHLFHFTPATIRKVLECAGWKVERIIHQRSLSNIFASIGYRILDRWPQSRLGEWFRSYPERGGRLPQLLHPFATLLAALGQTGRMTVWARRA